MKVVITASYNRSMAALVACEILRRKGHSVEGVIIISAFSVKRIIRSLIDYGMKGLLENVKKFYGKNYYNRTDHYDPLETLKRKLRINQSNIRSWCKCNNVAYHFVNDINSLKTVDIINMLEIDALVFCGGGIIRKDVLRICNGNIINMHAGPLPEIRGMNAVEWAYLLNLPLFSTLHFIDEGIDTGPIISKRAIETFEYSNIDELRKCAIVSGLLNLENVFDNLKSISELKNNKNQKIKYVRQCFKMSPLLKDILNEKIAYKKRSGGVIDVN